MSLRTKTLLCLKERLLNLGPSGKVFSSFHTQCNWLLGDEEGFGGLIRNPKAALAQFVEGAELTGGGHAGVVISDEEESELKKLIGKLFNAESSLLSPLSLGGIKTDGIALTCPDPTDPKCWY